MSQKQPDESGGSVPDVGLTPTEGTPLLGKDKAGQHDKEISIGEYSRQIVIAGTGFLADAYDLFVIDLVISILHRLHPDGIGATDKSFIASSTLIGAVTGQLLFGCLGDWLGRKWTFLVTCFLIVFGALASACVVWTEGPISLVVQLAICRFLLGVGVGGEYPLAATIAAESSDKATRGQLIATVFSMQGWGMLLSCIFTLLFLACGMPLEIIWRVLLALGAVPSAAVIYLRAKMEETEMFQKSQEGHLEDSSTRSSFANHAQRTWKMIKQFWHPLVGTTMTWLLLDVTFYGMGSFKSRIGGFLVHSNATTPREEVWHEAMLATVVVGVAIPGYLLSICYIEVIGRYRLQFGGFIAMSVCFFFCAFFRPVLTGDLRWILMLAFGLTFLFSNFGPNTTTFAIPVEVYPTVIRATCHGISAAAGKVGAVIGAAAFSPMEEAFGLGTVLICCGVVALLGAVFTFFFTSDKILDLSELDDEVCQSIK